MVHMNNNALDTVEAQLREQATAYCETNNVPGFVAGVYHAGEQIIVAHGTANIATGAPMLERHRIPLRLGHQGSDHHAGSSAGRARGSGPRHAGRHVPARICADRGGRAGHDPGPAPDLAHQRDRRRPVLPRRQGSRRPEDLRRGPREQLRHPVRTRRAAQLLQRWHDRCGPSARSGDRPVLPRPTRARYLRTRRNDGLQHLRRAGHPAQHRRRPLPGPRFHGGQAHWHVHAARHLGAGRRHADRHGRGPSRLRTHPPRGWCFPIGHPRPLCRVDHADAAGLARHAQPQRPTDGPGLGAVPIWWDDRPRHVGRIARRRVDPLCRARTRPGLHRLRQRLGSDHVAGPDPAAAPPGTSRRPDSRSDHRIGARRRPRPIRGHLPLQPAPRSRSASSTASSRSG